MPPAAEPWGCTEPTLKTRAGGARPSAWPGQRAALEVRPRPSVGAWKRAHFLDGERQVREGAGSPKSQPGLSGPWTLNFWHHRQHPGDA